MLELIMLAWLSAVWFCMVNGTIRSSRILQQVRHQIAQLGSKVKQQVRLKVKQQVKTTVSAKTTFGTAKKKRRSAYLQKLVCRIQRVASCIKTKKCKLQS
jgi:hypothetical protein